MLRGVRRVAGAHQLAVSFTDVVDLS